MAHGTVTGHNVLALERPVPFNRTAVIVVGVLAGLAMAVLWSYTFVDDVIGQNVAAGLLGHDARSSTIGTGLGGAFYALVVGLAGTFTACNIAAFGAIGPLLAGTDTAGSRMRLALKQVGWVSAGLLVVAAVYGAVGAAIGPGLWQLSAHTVGNHVPVRIVQAAVIFTVLGLAFIWLGLAAAGAVPDPLAPLAARWPHARLLVMGGLIGGFLVGRPYPLFYRLFQEAAERRDVQFGAAVFVLTALGNVLLMVVIYLLLAAFGGRFLRGLAERPNHVAVIVALALLIGGSFMVFYWGVRLPARFGYGWFPAMPWS
jgi:hypothetical protein